MTNGAGRWRHACHANYETFGHTHTHTDRNVQPLWALHLAPPQLIRQNNLWAKFPFRVAVSFFQLVKISFIVYDKQTMRQRDSHVLQPARGSVCYRGRMRPHWTLSHAPINLQRKTSWAKLLHFRFLAHTRCEEETFNFPNTFRTNENSSPVSQCRHSRCAAKTSQFPRILFGGLEFVGEWRYRGSSSTPHLLLVLVFFCVGVAFIVCRLHWAQASGVRNDLHALHKVRECVGSMSSHTDGFFCQAVYRFETLEKFTQLEKVKENRMRNRERQSRMTDKQH